MNKITLGFFLAKSKKTIKGLLALFVFLLINTQASWGQVLIAAGNTVTENFDGIGATATAALPIGWKIENVAGARTVATAYASVGNTTTTTALTYNSAMSASASNGRYNFGGSFATDRAIGGISSSSASQSVNMFLQLTNNGSTIIKDFTINYDAERYRNGTNAAGFSIRVYYSTTGLASSWTELTGLVATFAGANADNAGAVANPMQTINITNKALSQSLAAGSSIYLAWSYSVTTGATTSNAQALGIDNISITANAPTSTTWTGSSWTNGAPTASVDAIIAGDYSVAANITAKSLTVNNNAIVTIPSGNNVSVTGAVTVTAPATFTLSTNANLIQDAATTTNSNTGTITVNRNSNPLNHLDYTMWSSPVSDGTQTLANFSPLTSQSPTSRFYIYDNTQGATGLYSSVSPTTPFATGTGYLIRMPNEDPANLGAGSTYYLGTSTLTYNGVFTGVPNNGTVTLGNPTPLVSDKYYAVGNPYPSTIGAQLFLNGNSTDGVLYFWRKTNAASGSAYATFTSGGATTTTPSSAAPDGTIAVGQGFIVKTGVAATTLNFTNAMRTANNSAQFFKTKNVVEKDRVWLNLTNATGVFSQALVAYIADATSGLDIYDGKYINDSPIALTSNINNEEYTIQGRPAFDTSDVVSLNFKTDVAGDYTIAIDHADGLLATAQEVYLVDSKTGTETNLKTSAYTFAAASGVDNTRFSLKYQKTLKVDTSLNDNKVTVYKNNGVIYVNSGVSAINNIKVYDIQGRLIVEQNNVKSNAATIQNLKATHQVLIVKVTSEDNKVISKKVEN